MTFEVLDLVRQEITTTDTVTDLRHICSKIVLVNQGLDVKLSRISHVKDYS